jgi:hypothetical protein
MKNVTLALAIAALVISIGAVVVAFSSPGPRGHEGLRGATGAVGPAGKAGRAAELGEIKACLPEFVSWIRAFTVKTESNSDSNAYWLTNAYLDTSSQQVSAGCRKVLGMK